MARSNSTRPPSYRLHKASGQAVVTIDRKDHYLGVHGTPESRLRYERFISAWMQGEPAPARESESSNDITVAEVCTQYHRWAEGYYVKDGKPTTEMGNVKCAIKALRESYASLPAREFSPLKLKTVRQRFIDGGLSRTDCNRFTSIVARIFRHGVENELIPPDVAHGLSAVKSLAKGRCEAPETDPVLPVDQDIIDATLPYLSPRNRAMVKIQFSWHAGPGNWSPCDRERSTSRKPSGSIVHDCTRPRTRGRIGSSRLARVPGSCLHHGYPMIRTGSVSPPSVGGHVSVAGYGEAIRTACKRAVLEPWSPNRLRHSGATRIRQQASLDAAQVILGHCSIRMTETYAERNIDSAMRIAEQVG